jgi:hypothetical protein
MIDDEMICGWRINYGLDEKSPEDAMRWWNDAMDGRAPAGAVAALGLALNEIERLRAALAQPNDGQPLQGGFNNAELRAAWDKKLPGQEPKGQELSAFAIGTEVGFAHARDLEMQDWNRLHHVCKKHGIHPGRTDDSLIDVIDHALEPPQADTARLDWIARQNLDELSMHLVIDAEHDGEYYVCGDSNKPRYGVTLRAAIDAAMET